MKKSLVECVGFAVLAAGIRMAGAETNYWDNNGAAPGFGVAGGVWGSEPKWSTDGTGATQPAITNVTTADDLVFGTDVDGLSNGMIEVVGDAQGFRSMTFGAASGDIAFSGGTLNLAAPVATLVANNASNAIGCALVGGGALYKYGPLTHTSFLTTNSAVVFPNASLAGFHGAAGVIGGGSVGGGGGAAIAGGAYFFRNDGTNGSYQLQILDGQWTKCVKVGLSQVQNDIRARVLYAKYINSGGQLGYDFDGGGDSMAVATSFGAGGYGAAQTSLSTAYVHLLFLTTNAVTIFANGSLVDVVAMDATLGGGFISGVSTPAVPYHFVNNGSNITCQLQCDNGGFRKCVKVELTQVGEGIAARVLYAKYSDVVNLGFDFDTGGNPQVVATSYTAGGYGVGKLILRTFNDGSVLTLSGTNTYSGGTTIGGGALTVDGAGQLGGGVYTGAVCNSGGLFFHSSANQRLRGAISGGGALVKGRVGEHESLTYTAFLTPTALTVFTNTVLADYKGACGLLGGAAIYSKRPFPADGYIFVNDGTNATIQMQAYDGGHTKCVKVELTQVGSNIVGRAIYAKYLLNQDSRGFDFDTGGSVNPIATGYETAGYGVARLTLETRVHSMLWLSGVNSYAGGTAVNAGVLEAMSGASVLPSSGGIVVSRGCELRLNVAGLAYNNAGGVGNGNPITVNAGGRLSLLGFFNAGHNRPITLDGATLESFSFETGDCGNYINRLTLRNGALVTGYPIRFGYVSTAALTVSGTNASTLAAGARLVNRTGGALTINVEDVTGDVEPDLVISGTLWDYAGFEGLPVVKLGEGTVLFAATNNYAGTTTIGGGTLALGIDGALDADNNLVLNGGVLAMGEFHNVVGTLTVQTNSTIEVGSGQLEFADSSAVTWGGSLTLAGELGPHTIRFGTTRTALTAEQLSRIITDEGAPGLDEQGYLVSRYGTLLLLR